MSVLPTWPDYALPAPPLNDSYKITLPDLLSRTDLEQGLPTQRNLFSSGPTQYAITWPMTPAQFKLFLGFKRHALRDGAAWFTLPVFDGDDYTTRTIRFVQGPVEPVRDGGEWMVSAIFETLDEVPPSETDTAAGLVAYGASMDLEDIVGLLHTIVHTDLPGAVL